MNAVEESVCADYHNLKKFAAILQKSSSTVSVGNTIDNEYSKLLFVMSLFIIIMFIGKKYESANVLEGEGNL